MIGRFCICQGCAACGPGACGRVFPLTYGRGSSRCPPCSQANARKRDQQRGSATARGYGTQHRNRARKVVAAAIRNGTGCYYCGGPPTKDDPFVGCHVDAQSLGGEQSGPLAAGHRSCNSRAAGQLGRRNP